MALIKQIIFYILIMLFVSKTDCAFQKNQSFLIRNPVDSVGFPLYSSQVDSFMKIVEFKYGDKLKAIEDSLKTGKRTYWKTLIAPHDDYSYVQYIYPAALKKLGARTIFIIGVAHKAKKFNVEDHIVFDSHDYWNAPYGKVKISKFRETIIKSMDNTFFIIHDSLQEAEHSLEPFLPVLQYYHNDFEIVPILVPYMSLNRMKEVASQLAKSIYDVAERNHLKWGKDFAIIISNDAVHYGDQDWGDKNYAKFGVDMKGYKKAKEYEIEIISNCFINGISQDKIQKFVNYTVQEENYKDYKWTWCGRYSVPFGMLTSLYLENLFKIKLQDKFIAYSTSLENPPMINSVKGLGCTAPANLRHWVGYACIAYD